MNKRCLVLKHIKWQDLLEEGINGRNAFRTGARIHFCEKNVSGLEALQNSAVTLPCGEMTVKPLSPFDVDSLIFQLRLHFE